ncbi:MAG: NAD(P)H-dependent oxidoreductase subunit E [Thermoprotei archaeon]|nr:MAG: NAD(P)H-dependent oxidoreductase subunit E [Thermoprotei archaeon]
MIGHTACVGGSVSADIVLNNLKNIERKPQNLVKALRVAQEVKGYLPAEVVEAAAKHVGVPYSRAFNVATFYHLFSIEPLGKYRVFVCMGTTCYLKGNKENLQYLKSLLNIKEGQHTSSDGLFTVEEMRCLGCCSHAPVIAVYMPNGARKVIGRATPEVIQKLIDELRKEARERGWVK